MKGEDNITSNHNKYSDCSKVALRHTTNFDLNPLRKELRKDERLNQVIMPA